MPDDLVLHRSVVQSLAERISLRGRFTGTSWEPATDMRLEEWKTAGIILGRFHRVVSWWLGDWWAFGEHRYGDRKAIVTAPDWTGPTFQTCMDAGVVSRAFEISRRHEVLPFSHHRAVAAVAPAVADAWLEQAARVAQEQGRPPPVRNLQQMVKRNRRAIREWELGKTTERASRALGVTLYSVIYADPPWRFEPRSRETGMDRAADNHYPTMKTIDICNLAVPSAENCVLFLWATAPMLPEALQVMGAWGFDYRTHCIWTKPTRGTGYWFAGAHELLLLGVKGSMPAPAPGDQYLSWYQEKKGEHSAKPDQFAEMIEAMFPSQPMLEMFARRARPGWDHWGNEAPPPADAP